MKKTPLERDSRRTFSPRQKADMFVRSGGKCEVCGKKIKVGEGWTGGHHPITWAFGGRTEIENGRVEGKCCAPQTQKEDTGRSAKARRQAGETGQQARRARRDKPLIQSRGFNTGNLKRKFNGEVVPR